MPEAEEKVRVVRKIKTPRDTKGLINLNTRPTTLTDVKLRSLPPRTARNITTSHITKGIRDIQRMGKKYWEAELGETMRIADKHRVDKASAIYYAIDRVNAAMAEVERQKQETQKFAEELQTANEEMQATNEEMEASNEELKATTEELERTGEQMQQFASVASHELQEPLRMVASYLQLIERQYRPKLGKKGKEFVDYAVDGAKRMQVLINDLLTYSRVSTQGKPFESTKCEDVLKQILSDMKETVKKGKAVITHDPLPTVMADGAQLGQVFQNLIGNAIKFSKKGKRPRIHISAKQKPREWVFSVCDNGIGIAPQHQERVFQIFQRLQTREEYTGTGIGLAVCKNIVGRHGGRLWIKSQLGKGATFYFTIPVKERVVEGKKKLGEILVEEGKVSKKDVEEALKKQRKVEQEIRKERRGGKKSHEEGKD